MAESDPNDLQESPPAAPARPAPEPNELRLGRNLSLHGDPEQRKALFAALAKAQGEYEPIKRTRTVHVQPKDGGRAYDFDYAPLEEVIDATKGALSRSGCAIFEALEDVGEGENMHTLLTHAEGGFIHAVQYIPQTDKAQARGSLQTYARRYQRQSLTGTAPEHDDDGNAADGNTVAGKADRPRSAPKQEPKPEPRKPQFLPASADELQLVKVLSDDELRALIGTRLDALRVAPNQLARAAKVREVAGSDYAQLDRAAREQLACTLAKMAVQP
jgi:hypothetical protein